jgi:hypothetical protein
MDLLVDHEPECEWRPIFCPVFCCKAKTVIFKKLGQHLTEHHTANVLRKLIDNNKETLVSHIVKECYYSKNLTGNPFQLSLNNDQFFYEMTLNKGQFYFWVYYHGSPEEAKNYKATIKVYNDDGEKQFTYNATVRSLDESKETIIKDENALIITASQVRRLVPNELLKCSVKVNTCQCAGQEEDGNLKLIKQE